MTVKGLWPHVVRWGSRSDARMWVVIGGIWASALFAIVALGFGALAVVGII